MCDGGYGNGELVGSPFFLVLQTSFREKSPDTRGLSHNREGAYSVVAVTSNVSTVGAPAITGSRRRMSCG